MFAAVWAVLGAAGLSPRWRVLAKTLSCAISFLGIAAVLTARHFAQPAGVFRGGIYTGAVIYEAIFITLAVASLRRFGAVQYILPVIGLIVGLHFLGLWRATDNMTFIWTAIGMCAVSLVALLLLPAGLTAARRAVAGFGCALVLWATALLRG